MTKNDPHVGAMGMVGRPRRALQIRPAFTSSSQCSWNGASTSSSCSSSSMAARSAGSSRSGSGRTRSNRLSAWRHQPAAWTSSRSGWSSSAMYLVDEELDLRGMRPAPRSSVRELARTRMRLEWPTGCAPAGVPAAVVELVLPQMNIPGDPGGAVKPVEHRAVLDALRILPTAVRAGEV